MKPTDEQLRDPKWWNENAPDGATHIFTAQPYLWYKPGFYWSFYERKWVISESMRSGEVCLAKMIPRPTKPAAPEWDGEGLPPVGCECEVLMGSYWHRCDVLGRSDEALWVKAHDRQDYWTIMNGPSVSVRPLRTKEQREREELADFLRQFDKQRSIAWCEDAAEAILSSYNLEPKQ